MQDDGKIVVAGRIGALDDFAVFRFNIDGTLDSTFGPGGNISTDFHGNSDVAEGLAIQSDGRVIVVGFTQPAAGLGNASVALARYHGVLRIEPVILPSSGHTHVALFINNEFHLRRFGSRADLIPPITLENVSEISIQGSYLSDRLVFDKSLNQFKGHIRFSGLDRNDLLDVTAVDLDVRFDGGTGNDTFLGGGGHDSAFGGSGNDSLVGAGGDDFLDGGADKDRLKGDAGNDLLIGNSGNDSLRGGTGHDTLLGETGRDTLQGEDGDDVLDGGDDEDFIVGSAGNDSMRGGNGKDTLYGGSGADLLIGSSANDYLFGDSGDDSLLGDNGDDQIFGGTGLDLINPGIGRDGIHDSRRVIDLSFTFDFDALIAGLV